MAMDYGTLRGVFALLILALFIIIVAWSFNKRRKSDFEDAANSIFDKNDVKDNKEETNKQETNNNV